jgi:GNAT superfamily N-acetyltransferase
MVLIERSVPMPALGRRLTACSSRSSAALNDCRPDTSVAMRHRTPLTTRMTASRQIHLCYNLAMQVRPYRPEDEDAVIGLMAEREDFIVSPTDRVILRLDHRLQLIGEQHGRICAYASLLCPPWFEVAHLSATVLVAADRRGEGIGGAMWQDLLAATGSATTIHASVAVGDDRSLAIAKHWGLSVYQTPIDSVITFDGRPSPARLPVGFRIEFLDDVRNLGRADLDRLLLAADTSPEADETGTHGMAGFDPTPSPVLGVVLHDADGPVGVVFTLTEGTAGHVLFTGIHPDFRGRGLARALKEAAHLAAYDRGVRRLTTSNEESNSAIRRLNESMGYQRLSAAHRVRRPL